MRKLGLIILLTFMSIPAMAMDKNEGNDESKIRAVESKYVCMVNNSVFNQEQIAVEVEGKTYYGCCPMCKARLEKDVSIRNAVDPVSGNSVDKATAIIGVDSSNKVYYFESEKNMQNYASNSSAEEGEEMNDMHSMNNNM